MAKPLNLRWLVSGPGAISGLIADGLIAVGDEPRFFSRQCLQPQEHQINWQFLAFNGDQRSHTSLIAQPRIDWQPNAVLIAVKAYDVQAALERLTGWQLPPDTPIILSHNGLVEVTSNQPIFPLITTHAAMRQQGIIRHTGHGESWISNTDLTGNSQLPTDVLGSLQRAIPPLMAVDDIQQRRWQKLLVNCVINPLTAIHGVANGALAEPKWATQKQQLIREFIQVAGSQGIVMNAATMQDVVEGVIASTANNRSSMLQDLDNGRPTEIGALNGYIVAKAREQGISVPTHEAISNHIKLITEG